MKGLHFIFLVLLCHFHGFSVTRTKILLLMGSRFEITAVAQDDTIAWLGINGAIKEIERIENLISTYIETSEISIVNQNAGIQPVKVSSEVYDLIYRSLKVSELTGGLFDITWASMDKIWKFDGSMTALPADSIIKKSVKLVNYKNVSLNKDSSSVFLRQKGMKIEFGAIGKGLAANKARDTMKSLGIANGIVIAGGDLITWGKPEDKQTWTIGIANPENPELALSWLDVNEMAVVTSGDYEKYAMIDGKRYSHIINPKTGYPAYGLRSVTIICPDAELADALATSVFLLGEKEGLDLVNKMKGVECIIISDNFSIFTSNGVKLNYYDTHQNSGNHNFIIK